VHSAQFAWKSAQNRSSQVRGLTQGTRKLYVACLLAATRGFEMAKNQSKHNMPPVQGPSTRRVSQARNGSSTSHRCFDLGDRLAHWKVKISCRSSGNRSSS
jgi:hypothetical protein